MHRVLMISRVASDEAFPVLALISFGLLVSNLFPHEYAVGIVAAYCYVSGRILGTLRRRRRASRALAAERCRRLVPCYALERAAELLRQNRTVDAVREVRQATGLGLSAAVALVWTMDEDRPKGGDGPA